MFDLHRHDEFSTFDGFGKPIELAKLAKELGYKSLCTTNHGNTNGLVQTYQACKNVGIKSILGIEGYFLPKWKEKTRGYHMCLIAKNLTGYGNINRIQFEGEKQKYYNPIWDFKLLEKYSEGLICTTACVAGYLAQAIAKGALEQAERFLIKLQSIFGDDLYIEVQPYVVSEEGLQEKVNVESIKLAKKLGIKLILTSDSHRGAKEDFPTYLKMNEIANHDLDWAESTYKDRYMPKPDDMRKRFYKMHKGDFGSEKTKKLAMEMYRNLDEIEEKCEDDYLSKLPLKLPKLHAGSDSFKIILNDVKEGLKKRGKYNKKYIERCKMELEVIKYHGFEDYFLIVADYVRWAKDNGIAVGPGRGSVCNCEVAYALGITEVDSLLFGLDFRRFLRKDKAKYPDIDLDFETSRRHEVIEYICQKYEGHAARICSYGLYKVDNLVNDLAKTYGLSPSKNDFDDDDEYKHENARCKAEVANIKSLVKKFIDDDENFSLEAALEDQEVIDLNNKYDDIFIHFDKLYKKVRFIGTHAAGVAITDGNILDYVALRLDKDGNIFTAYDLVDMESINVIKFDMLGLKTMESIGDLRRVTGVTVNYDTVVNDQEVIEYFAEGNCDGIFQFERQAAREILKSIMTDSFNDVTAASAMNRPGPLSLKMPEMYADGKINQDAAKMSKYWEYTEESYGTIIYQEQLQAICVNIGLMSWQDADKVMKILKGGHMTERALMDWEKNKQDLVDKFVAGATTQGFTKDEATEMFEKMLVYSFNKGHAVGYTLISFEEMFYKVHYPNEYWFCKLKYAKNEAEYNRFCSKAVQDGSVIFLPHVNYSTAKARLRSVEGQNVIQQGLSEVKNVGEKAADFIVEERKRNGIFTSFDDFYDRCKSRTVTSRVIDVLKECGALEFKKKVYLNRVTKYNSSLYGRS